MRHSPAKKVLNAPPESITPSKLSYTFESTTDTFFLNRLNQWVE